MKHTTGKHVSAQANTTMRTRHSPGVRLHVELLCRAAAKGHKEGHKESHCI